MATFSGPKPLSEGPRQESSICYFATLIAIKLTEYLVVGVSNPAFPVFNAIVVLIAAGICLGLANVLCYLRQVKFERAQILRVYLITSLMMAPVSALRMFQALSDEVVRPSWIALWIKGVQILVFLWVVGRMSRRFSRTTRSAEAVS